MTGIASEDWPPLLSACAVMLFGNVFGYLSGWTLHLTIVFAPLAIVVFGIVRYVLHGSPYPGGAREL